MPSFKQVPDCRFPISYISLDTALDQTTGLFSLNETDISLVETVRAVEYEARTVSATPFSS